MEMEKFLKKYFKQLHFNSMPAEVWARFEDWRKNGTLTDDMKNWVRDYMTQNTNGDYVKNGLPDPNDNNVLPESEARKLFVAFQNAFSGMAADLNSFKDKDPQSADFVNSYFGNGKLFQTSPAKQECKNGIVKILQLLQQHPNLQNYIVENTKKSDGKPVFESTDKLQALLQDCQKGKYDTDNSVQKKIQQVARTLSDVVGWYSSIDQNSPEYQAIYAIKGDLDNVLAKDAFATDPQSIPGDKLRNFREIYAKQDKTGLLQTLYFNRTIRDRFSKYDNEEITKPINKAEEDINWQDKSKENYVDPKISDVLDPIQQIQKWVSDTYSDTIKKYEELRGGTVFRRQEAKDIFSAIDKVKVKPTDGLDGLLKKKSDIEGKLNNPVSRQHFKWFTETMEPIAAKMPKAVAGAWKNANQMKAVIGQIILTATDPNNSDPHAIEKAETAMEIMTAMKYGMMTSKVMDAMKQTEFSIFSDGQLSWNKNEGIQFVTKAFDKSVKAAFLGVGYGITIIRNKVMMSGMKFKNKDNQNKSNLAKRFNDENTTKQQALRDQNTADTRTIYARQQDLQNLNQQGINRGTLNRHQYNLQQINNRMQNNDAIRQQNRAGFDTYNTNKQTVDTDATKRQELASLAQQLNDPTNGLNAQVAQKQNQLRDPATYAGMPDAAANALAMQIQQELNELIKQQQKTNNSYTDLNKQLNDPQYQKNLRTASRNMQNSQAAYNAYTTADVAYNQDKQQYDSLNNKIEAFNEATQEINELNRAITARNNALNNWPQQNTNKVLYLENYWNFLQTGKTKTWRLSTKKAQKILNKNNINDRLLMDHISQRGLAA